MSRFSFGLIRAAMITHGYVSTTRGQIHLWEAGAGPPLVLLAPAPRSARVYRQLLPMLTGFRSLALDTRGFGQSAPPDASPAMSDYAADVVRVLDSLEIDRAHLLGLHTGNKIAAALAAGWPDRVGRVVLVGRTHSIIADKEARNAAVRASMPPEEVHRAAPGSRSELLARWDHELAQVSRIWRDRGRLDATNVDAATLTALRDEVIDELAAWDGVDPVYAANFAFDLADALEHVQAPTLIIELVTEETALFGHQAAILKARMSDCTVLAIEEHDRTLLTQHPHRLADPVIAFLGGQDPSTAHG